jgi:hypothetical protein
VTLGDKLRTLALRREFRGADQSVEATLSEDIDSIIDRLEEVNERVDRRPRKDEIEEEIEPSGAEHDDGQGEESKTDGGR